MAGRHLFLNALSGTVKCLMRKRGRMCQLCRCVGGVEKEGENDMRYSIGLDIGIASVGFAVMEINDDDRPFRIVRIGSRVFDKPENPKNGASLALPRREARGMRRRIRRRSHRKDRIRHLIINEGILTVQQMESLYNSRVSDIYELRRDALDRIVTNEELARILIHLSQRRGFKSNRKTNSKDKEEGKLLEAIKANAGDLAKYRTVGEMFYHREHKRNKEGNYNNTVSRDMILEEVHKIFEAQRKFYNPICGEGIEQKYCEILASQRSFDEGPGEGHEKSPSPYAGNLIERMVGYCTFEGEREKRAPKAAYSFELFNLLQKVNHLRIEDRGYFLPLSPEQRKQIVDKAHKSPGLNFKQIREMLGLPLDRRFNYVRYDWQKNAEEDVLAVESKTKFEFLKSYHEMRKALDKVSKDRIQAITKNQRNEIARIFSMYKNEDKLKSALDETELENFDKKALLENLGSFNKFGHLSVKALDAIIPYLEEGMTYDKAASEAGYDFKGHVEAKKDRLISLNHLAQETENTITSPVVRRALSQCAKVINAVIREMGKSPVYINIELAREMAKNFSDRNKLDKSMQENQSENERIKERIKEMGITNPSGQDIVKMKLYEQQGGTCLYSLKQINVSQLFEPGYADVDHIIPYSISFNDSYSNKVCVLARENRQKGDRLPLQYLAGEMRDRLQLYVQLFIGLSFI